MKKKSGFTLIELIIVVTIIGILTALVVPMTLNYVTKAKKRATIANGRILWNEVNSIVCISDETYNSFYTLKQNTSIWYFESSEDGRCVRYHGRNTGKKMAESNYFLNVVCRVDGAAHSTGIGLDGQEVSVILNTWDDADYNNKNRRLYMEKLTASENLKPFEQNGMTFPLKMPYNGRDDGKKQPIVRWIICTRKDDPEKIEIWAGDGTKAKNGPVYRVYPNPASIYTD